MLSSGLLSEAFFFLEFEALLAGAYAWYFQAETSSAGWLFLVALHQPCQFFGTIDFEVSHLHTFFFCLRHASQAFPDGTPGMFYLLVGPRPWKHVVWGKSELTWLITDVTCRPREIFRNEDWKL